MAHQDRQKINSWYTDSTYNADEIYENSPFATDPRTFPMRASTATSMSYSQAFAMIPLPSHHELHTIEETRNEGAETCIPAVRRLAESSALKNEELVEKSLQSISLIRSRLLQQQAANRKKNGEFQQMKSSLDLIRSLVHLTHDETSNKTFVKFSTEDFKILPHGKNFQLKKIEKETVPHAIADSAPGTGTLESTIPIQMHSVPDTNASFNAAQLDISLRKYKAMSTAANVPTTPTKVSRAPVLGMPNYQQRSQEELIVVGETLPAVKRPLRSSNSKPLLKDQINYYRGIQSRALPSLG